MDMPQSRNDHPDHGNVDVGPGLVENEEIEAKTLGKLDAAKHLIAPIEARKFLRSRAPGGRFAVRQYVGMSCARAPATRRLCPRRSGRQPRA